MEILTKNAKIDNLADVSFSKKGEINASDRTDAIRRIAKYITAGETAAYDESVSGQFTADEQSTLISRFASPNVRMVIGQAMASPIKTFLEYKGVMRRALKVDPLAPGALPVYDKDTENISAEAIASQSAVSQVKIEGERIMVPIFEIAANPTVKLREVKIRRFNMIDRIQVRTRQFMQEAEDAAIINTLDKASVLVNPLTVVDVSNNEPYTGTSGNAGLGYIRRKDFVKLAREISKHDLFAVSYFMSIYRYADIEMWGRDELDILTQKQIIDTGLIATLQGRNIYVTKKIPFDTIYCTADPDYVGVMPIYQDIEVIPADLPWETAFGWVFTELLGISVFNPKGVAKLVVKS